MRWLCLLLALALQSGCSREPDFSERYDAASEKIGATATEIDAELEMRANEAKQIDQITDLPPATPQDSGSRPADGP